MTRMASYKIVLCTTIAVSLLAAGCGNDEKAAMREENVLLSQRVTELESQVAESQVQPPAYANAQQSIGPSMQTRVYLVVKGDTLWSIAKRQLGNGQRYKEILALNPHVAQNKPLPVGTTLTLPAR